MPVQKTIKQRLAILLKNMASQPNLDKIAMLARQIIEERTLQGRFLNSPKGYTPGHAKKRGSRSLQTSYVDLQFSGAMWGSFSHEADANKMLIELGFNRDELAKIASYHDVHGAGVNKVMREFMGLTGSETKEVADFIMAEFGKAIDHTMRKELPGYP